MASVTIFIRNIPADATVKHLREFVESGFAWRPRFLNWLRRHRVVGIRVITLVDPDTKETHVYGLATIEPESGAEKIIKRLNRKLLKGRRTAVRRYCKRSRLNDRRLMQSAETELLYKDRRYGDRRKRSLEEAMLKTEAVDAFSRRLI